MSCIDANPVPVNRNFSVADVWHVHDFLIWAHARGYIFARLHGVPDNDNDFEHPDGAPVVDDTSPVPLPRRLHVLNYELANRQEEIRSLVLEFFSEVMRGEVRLTL